MLTFSRGQRGEPPAAGLAPLVKEAVKLLRSTMPATLELETELDDEAPQVMLDPVQVDQVLLNLCINARDATDGHGAVTVGVRRGRPPTDRLCARCRKRVAGDFVELAVRDTGPGIAPEVMERMFEPFFSTKEVGKGSGMGLATVHGIVHEHGGHIVVESQPGPGRVVPRAVPDAAGGGGCGANPRGKARAAATAPRVALAGHVMVVDDEAMVSEFMKELLESWGLDGHGETERRGGEGSVRAHAGAVRPRGDRPDHAAGHRAAARARVARDPADGAGDPVHRLRG